MALIDLFAGRGGAGAAAPDAATTEAVAAVTTRVDQIEQSMEAASDQQDARFAVAEAVLRESVCVQYQPNNAHRFVWVEIDGYRYRFEYLSGSRAANPLTAPTSAVLLLHDGDAIDYAPAIMRHARAGQLFREAGGRLYEYKGGMTTIEEYGTSPSVDTTETYFRLDAR